MSLQMVRATGGLHSRPFRLSSVEEKGAGLTRTFFHSTDRRQFFFGFMLMASAVILAMNWIVPLGGDTARSGYLFLLPWILLLAVVLVVPAILINAKYGHELGNPISLATFLYLVPAFVIGGFALATGVSETYILDFVEDSDTNFPFAVVLIVLGHAGMIFGYLLPPGRVIGGLIESRLPKFDRQESELVLPGFLLLILGLGAVLNAMSAGVYGFQSPEERTSFDGLIYSLTFFYLQGMFLLWFVIFRKPRMGPTDRAVAGVLIATALFTSILAGNRGSLLASLLVAGTAFVLAGRRITPKVMLWSGSIGLAALLFGMVYGTTFREVKGGLERVDLIEYGGAMTNTMSRIASDDPTALLEFGVTRAAERLDTLSSLGVVVSNYERLAPYEEIYGLDNNILKDTSSFFIPRFLWPEKPVASSHFAYGELYFGHGENAYAITVFGDLLRNFGVPGVFFGMFVVGFVLRVIYRALIEDQAKRTWRVVLYFMLVSTISYESFYGNILPMLVKIGFTSCVGIIFIEVVASARSRFAK